MTHPPYCVQVELVEGCSLRCSFCGIHGIRGSRREYKFMTVETAITLANQIRDLRWTSRIEFAMHGEPTLNPAAAEIVQLFRAALPRAYLMLSSNGTGIASGRVTAQQLFAAGLNTLLIDEYVNVPLAQRVREMTPPMPDVQRWEYPSQGPGGNPHRRQKEKRLVFVAPIDVSTKGSHSTLNNHTGSGAPLNDNAAGKRCAKPFREFSVRWNGGIALCCNDWRGRYVIGNIMEMPIGELWNSPRMDAARRRLYLGRRDFTPCRGCDATSYRPGLLPDPRGKETLEPPIHGVDDMTIQQALEDGPMAEPVLRPWEEE